MRKMKRVFSVILCIAVVFSIFAISAYADRGTFWAASGSGGYLKEGHALSYYNYNLEKNVNYIFPKYSTIRLSRDLYTNDEYVYGTVTDVFSEDKFSLSDKAVPTYKVYIATATDRILPELS